MLRIPKSHYKPSSPSPLALCLASVASGFIGGLLGTGGGIVTVFVLAMFVSRQYGDDPTAGKKIFATALAIMLPLSLVSLILYLYRGVFADIAAQTPREGENPVFASDIFRYYIPAAIGGFCGGMLLYRLNLPLVRKIFAAVVIFSGVMIIYGTFGGK